MTRVFLDASCWVAAAGSSGGGSEAILKLAQAGYLQIVVTQQVLKEAEHNIKNKLNAEALLRYYQKLGNLELEVFLQQHLLKNLNGIL